MKKFKVQNLEGERFMTFNLDTYLQELEKLVNIDSGSKCLAGVERVGEYFADKFKTLGWKITRHNFDQTIAPCFEISNTDKEAYDVLLLGHIDTVFPAGTVQERPFIIKDKRAYGPGVIDMKSCILSTYYALEQLQAEGKLQDKAVCLILNSEEEVGSNFTQTWIETLAAKSRYVLVIESARVNGDLVLSRKGLGRYDLEFKGVSAHAGVAPENGISAIGELAYWITELHSLTDIAAGLTVNVGVVSGGTAANVIAEQAKAEVDFRYVNPQQIEQIERKLKELIAHSQQAGVKVIIQGGANRPPMMPNEQTKVLCALTEKIGQEVGVEVNWAATGGGSDGNFTAAIGIPTIDGLGPVGGGAHSATEYLEIESIEKRLLLLKKLIERAPQL